MFEKILVCLDGSELAEQILPFATEQALRMGSTLVLFYAVPEPTTLGLNFPGTPATALETSGMFKHLQQHSDEAEKYLTALEKRIQKDGVDTEHVVTPGRAGEAIVDYSALNGIGLIALSTHGRGGLGRALFGSVADYVLKNSGLPNLIIRPRPE
jgi:nucleotide-binding universal stress UspA family protein